MAAEKILIVDDEPDIRELLEITLLRMGLDCIAVASADEARQALKLHSFRLCLTDMNLGDSNGIEVIEYIQQHHPELPVAMITAYGNMETAIEAMKAGAFDYVAKPIDLPKLRALIQAALKIQAEPPAGMASANGQLLGSSKALQNLRIKIAKLARSLAPVFIHGE
ncbi:MAG TPA: response regulator, partial [Pseudomonadales bacterium]